jgi:osmotically-inducible protein OsmY
MRPAKGSRTLAYDLENSRRIVVVCAFILALWVVWPVWAQQADDQPADLPEAIATADVEDAMVERITIDGQTEIEVLDVEGEGDRARVAETAPPTAAPDVEQPRTQMPWDQRLVHDLERRLQDDPLINAEMIEVTVSDGAVTLSGTVPSLTARLRAQDTVRTMRGVREIENNLIVQESDLPDATIRSYVQAALSQQPGIDVAVNEGEVTLTGTVASWQEKQLAGQVAAETHGVHNVRNDIAVEFGDVDVAAVDAIENEVKQRLRADPWIDANAITVEVDNGTVKLAGPVQSLAQQERAYTNAWVRGVQNVDISGITVSPFDEARLSPRREERAEPADEELRRISLSDQEIQEAVTNAFGYSPRLRNVNAEVEADNGVVVLTGTADTIRTKRLAEEVATNIRGVRRVENELEVRSSTQTADTDLADKVRTRINDHPELSQLDVAVTVLNGEAYLSGTVATESQQRDAAEAAASIAGITKVLNSLNVPAQRAPKPDFQLRQDIESAFYWSPYIDADGIDIVVNDGVATLTGTVDRWVSRMAAENAARQMGARVIDNRIAVLDGFVDARTFGPGGLQPGVVQAPGVVQSPGIVQSPGTAPPGTVPPTLQPGVDHGVTQPGAVQPGATQPGAAQPGAIQPGAVQPGAAQPGAVQPGATQPGGPQPGATQPGVVQPGVVQPGAAQPGAVQPGATQPGGPQSGAVQPGATQPGAAQPGATQPGADHGAAQPGVGRSPAR